MNIEQNNKLLHLLASWGKEKERKNTSEGKKKRKKNRAFADGSDSSVGRALHRYRRGHGFESRSGLNFFSGFNFATA